MATASLLLAELAQCGNLRGHHSQLRSCLRQIDVAGCILHRFFSLLAGFGGLGLVQIVATDGGI
jgi:hypothetical protein